MDIVFSLHFIREVDDLVMDARPPILQEHVKDVAVAGLSDRQFRRWLRQPGSDAILRARVCGVSGGVFSPQFAKSVAFFCHVYGYPHRFKEAMLMKWDDFAFCEALESADELACRLVVEHIAQGPAAAHGDDDDDDEGNKTTNKRVVVGDEVGPQGKQSNIETPAAAGGEETPVAVVA